MKFQFTPPERKSWSEKIIAELKENSDRVTYKNEIEEIIFDITKEASKSFDFIDFKRKSNEWKNCYKIIVTDEVKANQACLMALMHGADSLFFEINSSKTDWSKLFNGIQFEYLETRIYISDKNERSSFEKFIQENGILTVQLLFDPFTDNFKENERNTCLFNGFELQQIGANSWQEIGILLSTFHELILKDSSDVRFNFHLGVGSNYFVEIAKIRAIKWLSDYLCRLYKIEPEIHFSAEVGFSNKSLKDPHTNLLRQTTEAMSAISGGVSKITIRPYDDLSEKGSNDFSRRMALNISNILKEESYFDFVKDPLKGSHIIEMLTEQIVLKTWDFMKSLEKFESINGIEKMNFIREKISETRSKRLKDFNQKKIELIGVNSFKNEKEEINSWSNQRNYLELPYLIFENCN